MPRSVIRPFCMTSIISAFLTVESLCAIIKHVLFFIRLFSASCICSSVRESTFEVASSRMSIGVFESIARAIVMSWRCPFDILTPPSERTVS